MIALFRTSLTMTTDADSQNRVVICGDGTGPKLVLYSVNGKFWVEAFGEWTGGGFGSSTNVNGEWRYGVVRCANANGDGELVSTMYRASDLVELYENTGSTASTTAIGAGSLKLQDSNGPMAIARVLVFDTKLTKLQSEDILRSGLLPGVIRPALWTECANKEASRVFSPRTGESWPITSLLSNIAWTPGPPSPALAAPLWTRRRRVVESPAPPPGGPVAGNVIPFMMVGGL